MTFHALVMPYLPKVVRAADEPTTLVQRPLSDAAYRTLEAFSRTPATAADRGVATIDVHDTISNVAWAYEKLRQAIDYQDEHLLRKNAIERILKRRLISGANAESVAQPLILELIRGRYLPNKTLPVTLIDETADILNRYIHLWTQVPHLPTHEESDRLFQWYLGMQAVEINELLAPTHHEEALIQLMYRVMHQDIVFDAQHLSEHEKNAQLYIAIHRTLLKSDPSMIRYHLFIRRHPDWLQPTPEIVANLGRQLPEIRRAIEAELRHPVGDLLQRLMKKYAIIFLLFDDLARQYGSEAVRSMAFPDQLVSDIKRAYVTRRRNVLRKIGRSIVRSFIYILLTKMLLLLLLEIPVERILYPGPHDLLPLFINVLFPPLLLVFLGVTIRPAGQKNEEAVVEKVEALVYRGDERNVLVRPHKPIRRSAFFTGLFRTIYTLTFFAVFGGIIWGLTRLNFTPISTVIFLLFLTIVSFFGIRVRLLAKELLVVDQRENLFTVLFDFLTIPILQVGRWISVRVPKINIMIFFLDVIIEAPFKAFLEAAEGFFGFLREKREEIY